jgi:Mrp family chromosome partitioning ATPase
MLKQFSKRRGEIFKRRIFNFFKKETPKPEEKKATMETPTLKPKIPHSKVNTFSFPNIKHIIAVASGKGGVGKSTVSGLTFKI